MPGLLIESDDVCLYITEKCNSNCIMCPMSEAARKRGLSVPEYEWEEYIDRIPEETEHITITGGEPFLQYQHLLSFFPKLNSAFPTTSILILTNGRALAIPRIQQMIVPVITERYCFAIPIHSNIPEIHDSITQTPGSFQQTMNALRFLGTTRANIEIRIVGTQLNIEHISDIFRFLVTSGIRITVINLIAMEVTGSAARERNKLWIDYRELYQKAESGIRFAIEHGIDIGLYNFPLCALPEEVWPISKHSISEWKVRYEKECEDCQVRDACGGMFYSVHELQLFRVKPFGEAM